MLPRAVPALVAYVPGHRLLRRRAGPAEHAAVVLLPRAATASAKASAGSPPSWSRSSRSARPSARRIDTAPPRRARPCRHRTWPEGRIGIRSRTPTSSCCAAACRRSATSRSVRAAGSPRRLRAAGPGGDGSGDVDAALLQRLADARPDCVLPLLHGAAGEDGVARRRAGDRGGCPYVGSPPDGRPDVVRQGGRQGGSSGAGTSPRRGGRAAARDVPRARCQRRCWTRLVDRLGLPLMVKPTRGGSSLGATIVHDAAELPAAMVGAYAYGDVAMIEEFVAGNRDRGLRHRVRRRADWPCPPSRSCPDGGFYDYNARYTAGIDRVLLPGPDHRRRRARRPGAGARRARADGTARLLARRSHRRRRRRAAVHRGQRGARASPRRRCSRRPSPRPT